jgi:hypothetical protein
VEAEVAPKEQRLPGRDAESHAPSGPQLRSKRNLSRRGQAQPSAGGTNPAHAHARPVIVGTKNGPEIVAYQPEGPPAERAAGSETALAGKSSTKMAQTRQQIVEGASINASYKLTDRQRASVEAKAESHLISDLKRVSQGGLSVGAAQHRYQNHLNSYAFQVINPGAWSASGAPQTTSDEIWQGVGGQVSNFKDHKVYVEKYQQAQTEGRISNPLKSLLTPGLHPREAPLEHAFVKHLLRAVFGDSDRSSAPYKARLATFAQFARSHNELQKAPDDFDHSNSETAQTAGDVYDSIAANLKEAAPHVRFTDEGALAGGNGASFIRAFDDAFSGLTTFPKTDSAYSEKPLSSFTDQDKFIALGEQLNTPVPYGAPGPAGRMGPDVAMDIFKDLAFDRLLGAVTKGVFSGGSSAAKIGSKSDDLPSLGTTTRHQPLFAKADDRPSLGTGVTHKPDGGVNFAARKADDLPSGGTSSKSEVTGKGNSPTADTPSRWDAPVQRGTPGPHTGAIPKIKSPPNGSVASTGGGKASKAPTWVDNQIDTAVNHAFDGVEGLLTRGVETAANAIEDVLGSSLPRALDANGKPLSTPNGNQVFKGHLKDGTEIQVVERGRSYYRFDDTSLSGGATQLARKGDVFAPTGLKGGGNIVPNWQARDFTGIDEGKTLRAARNDLREGVEQAVKQYNTEAQATGKLEGIQAADGPVVYFYADASRVENMANNNLMRFSAGMPIKEPFQIGPTVAGLYATTIPPWDRVAQANMAIAFNSAGGAPWYSGDRFVAVKMNKDWQGQGSYLDYTNISKVFNAGKFDHLHLPEAKIGGGLPRKFDNDPPGQYLEYDIVAFGDTLFPAHSTEMGVREGLNIMVREDISKAMDKAKPRTEWLPGAGPE